MKGEYPGGFFYIDDVGINDYTMPFQRTGDNQPDIDRSGEK